MQVEVDEICMCTKFGSVTSLVSEVLLLFVFLQKRPNFPFKPWTIVHGGQKIELAKNFHAS